MSHFLSNVTQRRLELRRVDDDRTEDPSLFCLPQDVCCSFRCVAASNAPTKGSFVVRDTPSLPSDGDSAVACTAAVWCGEHDGSISVRHPLSGDVWATIPSKPSYRTAASGSSGLHTSVFVFSLACPKSEQMWAGMSDGSIVVYDCATLHPVHTFHAHSTAVVAMTVANMPTHDEEFEHHMNIVVSASLDWTMVKWDTTTWQCLGRFTGHRVAVRCLAASVSGEFLVSGGDDGSLRMWSLEHVTELQSHHPTMERDQTALPPAWPLLQAHDGPASAVTFVEDAYIVSTGLDGRALVWSLTGQCLFTLEERPCGLSSIFHDSICGRLLVGGLDGIMEVYSDVDAVRAAEGHPSVTDVIPWEHLGRLSDHSGAYLAALVPVRHDALQRLWLVDTEGRVTQVEETLEVPLIDERHTASATMYSPTRRRHANHQDPGSLVSDWRYEGRLSEVEESLMLEADALRQTVVQSYSELRQHRSTLVAAERRERRRRELLVLKLGDRCRDDQFGVLRMKRWLVRRRSEQLASTRVKWFEATSHLHFLSMCFWRWILFARERSRVVEKQMFTDACRLLTTGLHKTKIATHLQLALREKSWKSKLQPLVAALQRRGSHQILRRFYFRWFTGFIRQRSSDNRSYLAGSRHRVVRMTQAAIDERGSQWEALHQRHREAQLRIAQYHGTATWGMTLLARAFEAWRLRVAQQACQKRSLIDAEGDIFLRRRFFMTWLSFRHTQAAQRVVKRNAALHPEVLLWEDTIRDASVLSRDAIAQQIAAEEEKARQRAALLAQLKRDADDMLDSIHEIKSDLVATGLRLQPGLDTESRVDAIFTYLKARGINTFQDVAVISDAKSEYALLPLYVVPPPVSVAAAASPKRPATPVRRGSAPVPGGTRPKQSAPPKPKSLLNEFEVVFKRLTQAVRNAAATHASQHPDDMHRLGELCAPEGSVLNDEDDWGVSPEAAAKWKRKETKECVAWIRRFICLYDCIRVKQSDATAVSQSYLSVNSTTAATQAQSRMIPTEMLRRILCNAPTMIQLATWDFKKSALEYVEAPEEADPSNQDSPRVKASTVKPRQETPKRPSPKPAASSPSAVAPTVARRNSSPATSMRKATPLRPAARSPPSKLSSAPVSGAAVVALSPQPSSERTMSIGMGSHASVSRSGSVLSAVARGGSPKPQSLSPPTKAPPPMLKRPFLGLRVAVGPPIFPEKSRLPSLMIAECCEAYTPEGNSDALPLPGPAHAAGIRIGDLLFRFAGYAVTDLASFNAIVARHAKPGASIPVQVVDPSTKDIRSLTLVVGTR